MLFDGTTMNENRHGSEITNPSLQFRRYCHRLKSMAREGNLLKQVSGSLFNSFLVRFNALSLLAVDFNLQQFVKIISLKMNRARKSIAFVG